MTSFTVHIFIVYLTLFFFFYICSWFLSPSFSSCASSNSCAFASSAGFKHRLGCYHSNFVATITVLPRAAAAALPGLLRWNCIRLRDLYWEGPLAGAASILQRWMKGFKNDLRPKKPPPCRSPLPLRLSSSLRTLACRVLSFRFGWGRHFLLTVLLFALSSFSLFSLHAGDRSAESLAENHLLFLLLHAEEWVDPQLSLNQDGDKKGINVKKIKHGFTLTASFLSVETTQLYQMS